jgi:uncharacterized membrane protein
MPDPKKSSLSDNSLGAIAYITFVPALFFLGIAPYNKSANVRFHAWQSIILTIVAFILSVLLSLIPVLNTFFGAVTILGLNLLVWILWCIISIWCAISALRGKRLMLPGIGAWADRQSKK